ncbi:hypothetical protein IJ843_06125 [bacterium]|nr:hypothetical protein [bacterium]
MKKIFLLIVCILLSNICFANSDNRIISNKRGYILQALDDGALGYICPKWALVMMIVDMVNLCILISTMIL